MWTTKSSKLQCLRWICLLDESVEPAPASKQEQNTTTAVGRFQTNAKQQWVRDKCHKRSTEHASILAFLAFHFALIIQKIILCAAGAWQTNKRALLHANTGCSCPFLSSHVQESLLRWNRSRFHDLFILVC